jgi:hypothetical protein
MLDQSIGSASETERDELSFELRCSTRKGWGWSDSDIPYPVKKPVYEPASDHASRVERPTSGTARIPITCPRCGKELVLEAQSRPSVSRTRRLWLALTFLLYGLIGLVVLVVGPEKTVNSFFDLDVGALGGILLIPLIVPVVLAFSSPLDIVEDPGEHKVSGVKPRT